MFLYEVGIPNGFIVENNLLKDYPLIKKVEYFKGDLVIYFDEVNF